MSCIIVAGCYRSGTSVIAGVLHHLGVFVGKNFDQPNANNRHGYWEDIEFKELHKLFDSGDADEDPSVNLRYTQLVEKREKEHDMWGVKDPLLCTNLTKLSNCLKTDHRLIVCRRPSHDVSASMSRSLKQKDPLRFVNIAEFYIESLNKNILNYYGPILEMDHDQTLKEPEFHINRISNFISVPVTKKALLYIKSKN